MNPPDCALPLIDAVWKECRDAEARYAENAETKYGNPPRELHIMQATDARWDRGWCKEPYVHAWRYSGGAFEETEPEEISRGDEKPDGMYWRIGLIQFVIDEANRRSIYHYTLGPRYGRGFKATFEDFSEFKMIPDRDRGVWIS